jgi:fructoselysine-6-P-deglycase FrlB-like protein
MCLAVSHGGGTRATALAVAGARAAGARTATITNTPGAGAAAEADQIFLTPLHDESWCHTVAYSSALLTGAILAARLGEPQVAPAAAGDLLRHAIGLDVAPVAQQLADRRIILCAGAGVDHVTARELALKIAEGTRIPATAPELETVLHGQLVGHDAADALIIVALHDGPERERLALRAGHVAQAVAAIGLPVAALLSPGLDRALAAELTPAGRIVVTEQASLLESEFGALLAGAALLQALTLGFTSVRATNPDLIRREEAIYRQAAHFGKEESTDW